MGHAYVTPAALKGASALNITGTANDDRLLGLAEAVSGVIDHWCNRRFFALHATMRFDGSGGAFIGVPDLISVDNGGLRVYERGYGAYPMTWAASDYRLLPHNADPASGGNPNSRPYTRVQAAGEASGRLRFPPGCGNVEISGVWGWWQHLRRAARTVAAGVDANAAALTLSAALTGRAEIDAGSTLLIGDEQIYVWERDGETLRVERAVNGTTAGAIAGGAAIDIYEYPAAVREAALLLAVRLWRSARGGVDDWQAADIGIDSDIGLLLLPYRKSALGVF